jgi:hypothetical protein
MVKLESLNNASKTTEDRINGLVSAYSKISSVIDEFNEYGEISVSTTRDIISLGDEYIQLLEVTDGKIRLNTEAVDAKIEALKAEMIASTQASLAEEIRSIVLDDVKGATEDSTDASDDFRIKLINVGQQALNTSINFGVLIDAVHELNKELDSEYSGSGGLSSNTEERINNAIRNAQTKIDLINATGGSSAFTRTGSTSRQTDKWKEEAEDRLSTLRHLRRMELINEQQYYKSVEEVRKKYYEGRTKYIREERSLLEELFDLRRKMSQDEIKDMEHSIFLLSKQDGTAQQQIDIYKNMQAKLNEMSFNAIQGGLAENADYIQGLQRQWWQYYESIKSLREGIYTDWLNKQKEQGTIMERDGVDKREIISHWRETFNGIETEIETFNGKFDNYSKQRVATLTKDLWDIRQIAASVLDDIVRDAVSSLNIMTGYYDSLLKAAQEYVDSGFITAQQFQTIIANGIQYLHFLEDENGQLHINKQAIYDVIAARTEQLALETALNYVYNLRQALEDGNINALNRLLYATASTTKATWDLVYANLALLNLEGEQYVAAERNINNLRSLMNTTLSGIGKQAGMIKKAAEDAEKAVRDAQRAALEAARDADRLRLDAVNEQERAVNELIRYVMDMIRWETRLRIDGLREQIRAFEELIGLRKQELREMQRKQSFERSLLRQTRDLAKLQSELHKLNLDNSGDPAIAARRRQLAEQIAEMQGQIDEKISDKHIEETEKAYDEELRMFKLTKEQEIRIIEDTISSTEKLYQLAINRINNNWKTLYDDLMRYNYAAGNVISQDISNAWHIASSAMMSYNGGMMDVLGTLRMLQSEQDRLNASIQQYATMISNLSSAPSSSSGSNAINNHTSLGNSVGNTTTPPTPPPTDNRPTNTTPQPTVEQQVKAIVDQMKAYSARWGGEWATATPERRAELDRQQFIWAAQVSSLLNRPVMRGPSGWWYLDRIGGPRLYEKYHQGGMVGGNATIKENEVFTLLEKGEAVLTKKQKENMNAAVETVNDLVKIDAMSLFEKFGGKMGSLDSFNDGSISQRMFDTFFNAGGKNNIPVSGNRAGDVYETRFDIHVTGVSGDDVVNKIKQSVPYLADQIAGRNADAFRRQGHVNRRASDIKLAP